MIEEEEEEEVEEEEEEEEEEETAKWINGILSNLSMKIPRQIFSKHKLTRASFDPSRHEKSYGKLLKFYFKI